MPTVSAAESDTVVVHIQISFARRGGRKALIAPDGSSAPTLLHPHANGPLVAALARAFRWRRQMETGAYATVAEIAAAEGINDSYASRILRLTLLAPDIVEVILDRRHPTGITLDRLMRPFPVAWERQRSAFSETAG